MDPYTDSDSDNDAPEEVSLSTARQSTKKAQQDRAQDEAKYVHTPRSLAGSSRSRSYSAHQANPGV